MSQWKPVYMGEGRPYRCLNCGSLKSRHHKDDRCRKEDRQQWLRYMQEREL